ncbi:hypothetical protein Bbelb_191300 [Branchiostoma belcheri]|nr:hypothetical protein Bbelb_191300 [Branchiostoma belcheri]
MNVVYLSDSVTQECLSQPGSSDVSEPCSLLTAARAVPSQEDLLLSNLRTSGSALDEPVSPVISSHEDVLLSNVRTSGSDLARPASRVISSGEDVMLSDLRTGGMDFDSSAVKLLNELSVCPFVTDFPTDRPTPSVVDFASWHARVRQSGVPNFTSERIPVPTKLHVSAWRGLLDGFHDTVLCDFLEFGFPVNYESSAQPRVPRTNHPSALQYSSHVDRFISTELSHGATIGPLSPATFSPGLVCNPLQTVPKKASPDRRIVVDYSYPPGSSVNDGIPTGTYLGQPHRLRYPSMDDFVALVVNAGPGCLMFKRDLRRAYRQLFVDPADYHLLGFSWRGNDYADVVCPFGLRSSAQACQRTTDAVAFIYNRCGFRCVNYLDDLGGADSPHRAELAFDTLGRLLQYLGLMEADDKATPPSTRIVFLGRTVDSIRMTIEVTPERLSDTLAELDRWRVKTSVRRHEVESLLGKLHFLGSCVRPGRLFVSRMILLLRRYSDRHQRLSIDCEFRKDLLWWSTFLPCYNGVSLIPRTGWTEPDAVFSSDACLTGCGGFLHSTGEYFHATFPPSVLASNPCINSLELLSILVCARLWGKHWAGSRIVVMCDNEASVTVLNSGRSRSPFLQTCLRNLWLCAAVGQFELRAIHIPGLENRLADHLSRWTSSKYHQNEFLRLSAHMHACLHTQLQRLDNDVEAAKRSAFAAGTYANLRTQWKAFLLFCEYFRLPAIPTDARTLTRYAQFLSRSLKSPSTVQIYIHGARLLQRFQGCEPPPSDAFELRLVLSSFRRQSPHIPQRTLPITPAILLRLRDHLDLNRPLHATLWAAYTVAFFTLLRKSNLVPKTTSAFDPGKHLTRGAIRVTSDGLVVRITWSKTLQFKQRVLLLPVPAIPGHPLCPRHAYVNMCSLLPVGSDSPAFLVPGSAGRLVSLTHASLVAHLKTLLAAAGLPSGDYSGHSFRRGGATFAWHCGADPQIIKLLGDWSSDAFQSYLDSSFEQRRSFATLLATRINQGFLEPDRDAV